MPKANSKRPYRQTMAALLPGKPPEQIPNKTNANIIAAYTDYASDKDGDYTFVLGAKVNSGKEIPRE